MKSVFLDLPLESIHKLAFKAAQASNCAGEQDKYWEMHDRLFANQAALEPWTPHAEAIGLDVAKFEPCLASGKFDQEIRRAMAEAQKAGVTGTPGFMIGRTEPGSTKVKILSVLKAPRPSPSSRPSSIGCSRRPPNRWRTRGQARLRPLPRRRPRPSPRRHPR